MYTYNWKMPAVTATGIIFFKEDNMMYFVLAKRNINNEIYPGEYCFPGGFLNVGEENVVETIRRESREELNIFSNADDWTLFHVQNTFKDVDSRNDHTVNVCYYNNLDSYAYGKNAIINNLKAGDDIGDYRIVSFTELKEMALAFDHKEIFYSFINYILGKL